MEVSKGLPKEMKQVRHTLRAESSLLTELPGNRGTAPEVSSEEVGAAKHRQVWYGMCGWPPWQAMSLEKINQWHIDMDRSECSIIFSRSQWK